MAGFFHLISDYPADRETGWTEELQGVTHDDANWFFVQKNRVWKIPAQFDLSNKLEEADPSRGILSVPLPPSLEGEYDHMGDPDYFEGRLYIPIESIDYHLNARIICLDAATLSLIGSAELSEQTHAPWCAINPLNGSLCSSDFNHVKSLYVYDRITDGIGIQLKYLTSENLIDEENVPFTVDSVQGGVLTLINGANQLYLTSNNDNSMRGVHVFNLPDFKRIQHIFIDTEWGTIGEELEGLTYWDLDDGKAPNIRGQLHVIELDNDRVDLSGSPFYNRDDIKCFKHYAAYSAPYIANKNPAKREVHYYECNYILEMRPDHKVPYDSIEEAIADGYDGCFYCLPDYSRR